MLRWENSLWSKIIGISITRGREAKPPFRDRNLINKKRTIGKRQAIYRTKTEQQG